MARLAGAALLMCAALGGAASAQEFRGAEVSAELLTFTKGDDLTSNNYRGSVEFGLFGGFGVQADLSFYDFEDGDTVRSVTVHGLYDAFDLATVGAFYSQETVTRPTPRSSASRPAAASARRRSRAIWAGATPTARAFTTFGFDAAYEVTPTISVTASGAAVDLEGGGVSRLSVGGEFRFGEQGPAVYAEIGRSARPTTLAWVTAPASLAWARVCRWARTGARASSRAASSTCWEASDLHLLLTRSWSPPPRGGRDSAPGWRKPGAA
jgi:hypothetical protein